MRLIDVDKIDKLYYGGLKDINPYDFKSICQYFIDQIKAQPAVDAAPVVHAKFEIEKGFEDADADVMTVVVCSNCNFDLSIHYGYAPKYCPECGAKIDMED